MRHGQRAAALGRRYRGLSSKVVPRSHGTCVAMGSPIPTTIGGKAPTMKKTRISKAQWPGTFATCCLLAAGCAVSDEPKTDEAHLQSVRERLDDPDGVLTPDFVFDPALDPDGILTPGFMLPIVIPPELKELAGYLGPA